MHVRRTQTHTTTSRRLLALAAVFAAGALALTGCSAPEQPAPAPEAQQPESTEAPTPAADPDNETLYGVKMPRIKPEMTEQEKMLTQANRVLALERVGHEAASFRLVKIFTSSDPSSFTGDYDPLGHFDQVMRNTEVKCLNEKLDAGARGDYEKAVQAAIDVMIASNGAMTEGYEFMLGAPYMTLPHEETLAKTDELYKEIEATGCLLELHEPVKMARE